MIPMSLEKLTWEERELSREIDNKENKVNDLERTAKRHLVNAYVSLAFSIAGYLGEILTEKDPELRSFNTFVCIISGFIGIYNTLKCRGYIKDRKEVEQEIEELKQRPAYQTLESKLK